MKYANETPYSIAVIIPPSNDFYSSSFNDILGLYGTPNKSKFFNILNFLIIIYSETFSLIII